jgi:chaperonin GroES
MDETEGVGGPAGGGEVRLGAGNEGTSEQGPVEFEPFGDRVLVKQADEETQAKRGCIEIPEGQKEPPLEGTVLRVGPGRWDRGAMVRPEAEVGDLVVFGRYAGSPIWIDGVEYLLLRDEEILGRRRKQGTENRD